MQFGCICPSIHVLKKLFQQNSTDSSEQFSRATSTKSARSQSERPNRGGGGAPAKLFQTPHQPPNQNVPVKMGSLSSSNRPLSTNTTSASTSLADPLAMADCFPMVTPQKNAKASGANEFQKNTITHTQPNNVNPVFLLPITIFCP